MSGDFDRTWAELGKAIRNLPGAYRAEIQCEAREAIGSALAWAATAANTPASKALIRRAQRELEKL
jgi:uncharacterized heparinase superfamily protein